MIDEIAWAFRLDPFRLGRSHFTEIGRPPTVKATVRRSGRKSGRRPPPKRAVREHSTEDWP